jgi:hypothetical protein
MCSDKVKQALRYIALLLLSLLSLSNETEDKRKLDAHKPIYLHTKDTWVSEGKPHDMYKYHTRMTYIPQIRLEITAF